MVSTLGSEPWKQPSSANRRKPGPGPTCGGVFPVTSTLIREMTDLTDEQINEQIEAAYETLRNVVEQLGKKGASPLTLGVALIGVAVEIAVSVGGHDGETLIREIVEDRLAAHTETEEPETAH